MGYEISVKAAPDLPVHNIDSGLDYETIQEAIDAPETLNGHTIFIDNGTYYENIVVSKRVSLIGEYRTATIVDGNGTGTVITIIVNEVNISNLTVRNSGANLTGPGYPSSGIYLSYAHSCAITNTDIESNYGGIFLQDSSNNLLRNNTMFNNSYSFGVYSGYPDISSTFYNDVDDSNHVDGKPIYYWIHRQNGTIPSNAGFVALIDSSCITVNGLERARYRRIGVPIHVLQVVS